MLGTHSIQRWVGWVLQWKRWRRRQHSLTVNTRLFCSSKQGTVDFGTFWTSLVKRGRGRGRILGTTMSPWENHSSKHNFSPLVQITLSSD